MGLIATARVRALVAWVPPFGLAPPHGSHAFPPFCSHYRQGCFVGPLVMNAIVPPHPQALLWGNVASFGLVFLGLFIMLLSPSIALILLSTFIRSVGECIRVGWWGLGERKCCLSPYFSL